MLAQHLKTTTIQVKDWFNIPRKQYSVEIIADIFLKSSYMNFQAVLY